MRFCMILAVFGVVIATMTISTCNCAGVGGTGEGQLERTCNAPIAAAEKTGTCPPADMYLACDWCNDQCKSDGECKGTKKCCQQPGCGNWCKDPVS